MLNRKSPEHRRAKQLRRNQTDTERKLWMHLRARQLNRVKFRRQHPIGRYIVDFCCAECGLVVEVDGGHHAGQVEADLRRTKFFEDRGYRILRFWDNEVLTDLEAVLQQIVATMSNPHPTLSLQAGRGKPHG